MPEKEKGGKLPSKAFIGLVDVPLVTHKSRIRCGSYTTEWIARAIGLHPIPSNKVLKGPIWFDIFRPVLPRDMMKLFRFRGMDCREVDLKGLSDQERLVWIKKEIAIKRKPAALLVRTGLLHWIAVCGYDDESQVFYVYDSLYGNSSINPYIMLGNNLVNYSDMLRVWRGRWWLRYKAIEVSVSEDPREKFYSR